MIRLLSIVVFMALSLGGCVNSAEHQAQLAANDNDFCRSIGLAFGSPDYAACRMKLHDEHATEDLVRQAQGRQMMAQGLQMMADANKH